MDPAGGGGWATALRGVVLVGGLGVGIAWPAASLGSGSRGGSDPRLSAVDRAGEPRFIPRGADFFYVVAGQPRRRAGAPADPTHFRGGGLGAGAARPDGQGATMAPAVFG